MPNAAGRFLGISVPAEAWERVFGAGMHAHDHDWPCARCKGYGSVPAPGWPRAYGFTCPKCEGTGDEPARRLVV